MFLLFLNNGHQGHLCHLVPMGRHVAFDHRSGVFLLKKSELFADEPGPTVRGDSNAETRPPHLERTHSLMVIGASGQKSDLDARNEMSALPTK